MKRSFFLLATLFLLSHSLNGQNCALSINVAIGECDANGEISLGITISDPSDNARDVDVAVDGNLLPGSPFRVRDDEPIFLSTTVTGDGLEHLITVVSEDEENCSEQATVSVPDCSSDCFLSGLQLTFDGGSTHTIDVGTGGNNVFTPSQTTITVGDLVNFNFVDDGHTTTSDATSGPDSWNSGLRGTGTTFPLTIINPGLHRYYCVPHGGPNGSGMAGSIVANCPGSAGFSLTASFNTTQANAAGYNLVIDGQIQAGSPFSYVGTGPQSVSISLPGDGAPHTVEIIDITESSCTLNRSITAPDCGQEPTCSLFLSAEETGTCLANDQVNVSLTVMAVNSGNTGFNVRLDGTLVSGSPFTYTTSGNTNLDILVPGDGLNHTISISDNGDPACSATTSLTTTNCTIPCELSNLSASTGGAGIIHTVNVEDFVFAARDITIAVGDRVEWRWTGAIPHTATSDATSGPDSWDSGLLGTGATFLSPVLSAGIHPYYCIPHGGPNGVGMAGTITVLPDCTDGQVAVGLTFSAVGTGAGYNLLVDGTQMAGGPFAYDASGTTTTSVFVAGDGLSHTIEVRDTDDASCSVSTSVTTADCNASTCQITATIEETTGCDANLNVGATLTVSDVGGSDNGFNVAVDGQSVGSFNYSGNGTTTVALTLPGDAQSHEVIVTDNGDPACSATTSLTTTNCTIPCELSNLSASTGGAGIIHTVNVEDFVFAARDITIAVGDRVEWRWTGAIPHTATSDATSGPDSWDSGLLGNGSTFLSPVLSAGIHPYYCIPHGGPNGVGMAGTITVLPDCTDGQVAVGLTFSAVGTGAGYNLFVDGTQMAGGPFAYDASGTTTTSVFVAGDGLSHTIEVRDTDDASCSVSTSVTTADCNASTCQITATIEETTGCDANLNVGATLTVSDVGGSDNGFNVAVDGQSIGSFNYSGNGTTTVALTLPGDAQSHEVVVTDNGDPACSATVSIETTRCQIANSCNIRIATEIAGQCDAENRVLVRLTINNDEPGENGFRLLVNGNEWPGSPFDYVVGAATMLDIHLPATGQTSAFTVIDVADMSCTSTQALALPNCSGGCTITDLEVLPTNQRHEVAVRDFDFFPVDLSVEVGDTVVFVWTGQIPHTSTSDVREGSLVWDSGLLSEGAVYEVVITEPGLHGYYCIPHGGPNGVGMAGSITATQSAADGQVNIPIRFNASLGGNEFRVFLDGVAVDSTYTYDNPNGANEFVLSVPGDGQERLLRVQDLATDSCAMTISFLAPDIGLGCSRFNAGFTFTAESGFTLRFTGEATGATNWLWGFGDGAISREENPVHQYDAAGEYRICLLVQDTLNNCTRNYCETITVGTVAAKDPLGKTRLLTVYPNPVAGAFPSWTVSGLRPEDLGRTLPVSVIDANGRVLLERKLSGRAELHIMGPDNLPAGMYLLKIQGNTGYYLAKLLVQ